MAAVPILPLAPGLFSTTMVWPRMLPALSPTTRDTWSGLEPGPNGTISLRGCAGQPAAWAPASGAGAAASIAALRRRRQQCAMTSIMPVSCGCHFFEVVLLVGDESRHHGAVSGLDHFFQVLEAAVVAARQLPRPRIDLGLARRRADLERVALEAGGILDIHGAFGDQPHDFVVQAVDVGAHFGQRGAQRPVGRVLVGAQ